MVKEVVKVTMNICLTYCNYKLINGGGGGHLKRFLRYF